MTLRLEHLPADVLGLTPTAKAALAGRPLPPAFGGIAVPHELGAIPEPPERLEPEERRELAEAIQEGLAPCEPHVAVLDSARALAEPGTAAVVVGQQPGLFGGPLYNVYKALHAVRLARALAEAWGRPVVPVFWNHADDHDVAEVHHLWVQDPNLDLRKVSLAGLSSGREPLGDIVLDAERHGLGPVAELLRQTLWEGEHREEALELFLPRSGETFASAFTRLFTSLFGAGGLLVLEPRWIRPALSRALARVVGTKPTDALLEGAAALAEHGLPAPIDPATAALVFHHEADGRRALRPADDGFRYDGEPGSRTASELAAEIVQEPEDFSAGALLRPLVQDLALPVAAYVGGWGELAYHVELGPLRRRVEAPLTPFVPRLSATLVDPETEASLGKLGVGAREVLAAAGTLGEGEEAEPEPAIVARLREIGEGAAEELRGLRDEVAAIDRGLANQVKRAADQVKGAVGKLADKTARSHANASGRGRRHYRRLNNGLFPRGAPQERVRGAIEFTARFGRGWIDELLREIEPLPTEHVVVRLTDDGPQR